MSEYLSIDEAAKFLTKEFALEFSPITKSKIIDCSEGGEIPIYTNEKQPSVIDTKVSSQCNYDDVYFLKEDLRRFFIKQKAYWAEEQSKRNQQEVETRNELGRYTLDEAAELIGENAEIISYEVLEALRESVIDSRLKVYYPHGLRRYKKFKVLSWYAEAFWDDLNNWLIKYENRIEYKFPDPSKLNKEDEVGRQILQENKILEIILYTLNLDPQKLPPIPRGKPWVKSRVREALKIPRHPFQSTAVFNKAWERLLTSQKLKIENK